MVLLCHLDIEFVSKKFENHVFYQSVYRPSLADLRKTNISYTNNKLHFFSQNYQWLVHTSAGHEKR